MEHSQKAVLFLVPTRTKGMACSSPVKGRPKTSMHNFYQRTVAFEQSTFTGKPRARSDVKSWKLEQIPNSGNDTQPRRGSIDASRQQAKNKRLDPRRDLVTQAFVTMVPLSARAFQLQEVSRGGMFLAFKDSMTLAEIQGVGIDRGTDAEIAFAVVQDGARHAFNVRARIARITPKGIGFQFHTRNPPQLAGLRELFRSAAGDAAVATMPETTAAREIVRRVIQKPPDDSGWQDWEII